MKKHLYLFNCLLAFMLCFSPVVFADEHPTLAIGSKAPDFSLPGVDGKIYSLASFKNAKVLAVVFICNHCPTSQAYERRIVKLTSDYAAKGVAVVAINPNSPKGLRYDELGWSDVNDDMAGMKIRAKERKFNFPYLDDGKTEITSKKYGPIVTPHIFIFDKNRILRYNGRIDDMENPAKTPTSQDARVAIDALLENKEVPVAVTKVFGCSTKWAEKSNWLEKAKAEWAKEPVTIEDIDVAGVKELLQNKSNKLRLINVWATWCGPCVAEFPNFVRFSRLYVQRDFEFVSISLDRPEQKSNALRFLTSKQASGKNYIFSGENKFPFIEAVDPKWQGALPYTILVEPGGKIVYAKQAEINPPALQLMIFNNKYIGRLYKD